MWSFWHMEIFERHPKCLIQQFDSASGYPESVTNLYLDPQITGQIGRSFPTCGHLQGNGRAVQGLVRGDLPQWHFFTVQRSLTLMALSPTLPWPSMRTLPSDCRPPSTSTYNGLRECLIEDTMGKTQMNCKLPFYTNLELNTSPFTAIMLL